MVPPAPYLSARHAAAAGGPAPRGPPPASKLGPAQAPEGAPPPGSARGPLGGLARAEYRGRSVAPARAHPPAAAPALPRSPRPPAHPDDRAQPDLDRRLQGAVPHGRQDLLLSADRPGWVQPLPARLPRAHRHHGRREPTGLRAALPGVWPARDPAHRQRRALRHRSPTAALPAQCVVDPTRDLPRAHRAGPPRAERAP